MNIPAGVLELTVTAVVGFVFKVVFGLITKNEEKSDEADKRLSDEIKELRLELKESDERHRQHENDLFNRSANAREDMAFEKGKVSGRADLDAWIASVKGSK